MNLTETYDWDTPETELPSKLNEKYNHSSYTVEVITDVEEFDSLEKEWDCLARQTNVHLFQLFFWQKTWWDHFGKGVKLHIVLIRNKGDLVGIAPLFIDKYSFLKLYKFRYLRMIGSTIPRKKVHTSYFKYGMSDYLDFIVHSGHEEQVANVLMDHLKSADCTFDLAIFNDAPADSFIMRHLVPRLKTENWKMVKEVCDKCPYIELPDSSDDYLMSLDKKTRQKIRHVDKVASTNNFFRIQYISTSQKVTQIMPDLVSLHQQRWNKKWELGAFADKRYGHFLFEVCKKAADKDQLWMFAAYDGTECIAVDCAFYFNGRIYDYLKSMNAGHPYSKHRPGMAIQFEMIRKAIKQKIQILDLLRGLERYKIKITNQINVNWTVTIETPTGINFLKRNCHQLDTFFYINSLAFKRAFYLFKSGWQKQDQNIILYIIDFSFFILKSVITRLPRIRKKQ